MEAENYSQRKYETKEGVSGVGMASLGRQISEIEEHFRRGTETLAERDAQIAHLKETLRVTKQKYDDNSKKAEEILAKKLLEFDKALVSKEEEWKSKLEEQKNRSEIEIEGLKIKQNSDILKLAKGLRDEMETVEDQLRQARKAERELLRENEKLKAQLLESNKCLAEAQEVSGRNENELHTLRLELLKETNTRDRLVDELKRSAREIARLGKANEELRSSTSRRQSDIGQKVNEIHKMLVLNCSRKIEEEIVNVRLDIGDVVKGNAAVMNRLEEMDRFQRYGGRETASVGVQTAVDEEKMRRWESADNEAIATVIKLREDLVDCKNQMIDTKQQNEVLRQIVRDLKRHKEETERGDNEEEERMKALEENVRVMKEMVGLQPRVHELGGARVAQELEALKRELSELKGRQHLAGLAEPKQSPSRQFRQRNSNKQDFWN